MVQDGRPHGGPQPRAPTLLDTANRMVMRCDAENNRVSCNTGGVGRKLLYKSIVQLALFCTINTG